MLRRKISLAGFGTPFRAPLLLLLSLAGCGGGSSGVDTQGVGTGVDTDTGTLIIGLTDAEGDFVSYTVDVNAIRLETAAGRVVETLPLNTRVDFAELTDVTELLTIATVPAGVYQFVSLTLDYSEAQILVQDAQGNLLAARAQDESGTAIGEMTVRLTLSSGDPIRIRRGIPAAFSLDFDLDASNDINLSVTPAIVTVSPFLLATPELETDREHRVRGILAEVDIPAMEIAVNVRPFWHHSGDFGRFVLQINDDTLFEVDGQPLDAAEGLATAADLPPGAPLVALGKIVQGEFVADAVLAGTSVPWGESDVVVGVVTARSGETLTVQGARVHHSNGTRAVRHLVEVTLGADTVVTALGVGQGALSSQSVAVGQRIVAFGDYTGDAGIPVLDATQGRLRLQISGLRGAVVSADPLVVDLHLLNGRRPSVYNFSGTGVSVADDADPEHYQIATAGLPLTQLAAGDLVRVRGLVNAYGAAPDDFLARTVIDPRFDNRPATLVALWQEPAAAAVTSISGDSVVLDLSQARSAVNVLGWRSGADVAFEAISLLAPPSGLGVYALRVRGEEVIHLYRSFPELTAELLLQLETGHQLRRLAAHGIYDGSMELATVRASFELTSSVQ